MSTISKLKSKVLFLALPLVTLLPLISLLFLSTPTALAAGAREYENPPCYDVTGQTQAVLVGGVNNGGIMDFDDAGVPAAQAACVRMKADKVTPDHLEGWVWNDNLGWVSLYCPGGVGAKNLDIACGTQAYSVTFGATGGTAPDFVNVTMSGYAWGDNIGWISFDSTFSQLKPTPSGSNRGLIPTAPAADRYAWTDSVGWLDWTNVWFHWEDTDPPMTDPNVIKYISVCSSKDPIPLTSAPPAAGTAYPSNGNTPYYDLAINSAGTNLYVINVSTANLTRFDISTGTPVVAANYTSAIADQNKPNQIEFDNTNNRLYMVSYSSASSFGVLSLKPTTLGVNWAQPISHSWGIADMASDSGNDAVWVLENDNTNNGVLQKYRGNDGALLATLNFPTGVRSVLKNPSGSFVWVIQNDGKFVKVSNAGAFFTGSYASSLYNPGYSMGLPAFKMTYDSVDNAVWVGDTGNNVLYKLKAADVSPFNGTIAASTFTSPIDGPSYLDFDANKKVVWVVGSGIGTGKIDSQTGTNYGVYPSVTPTNAIQVVHDDNHNVIWTIEGTSPGKVWKTDRDPVVSPPGLSTCSCDLDGTCPIPNDPAKIPDADGTDDYTIKIPFVDGGVAIPNSQIDECTGTTVDMYTMKPGAKDYCAKIALTWEDDVDYDQTTKTSQQQDNAKYNANNDGAVRKPLTSALYGASDFTYDGVETLWGAKVTSFAPTSERNTMEGMPNEKFYYADSAVTDGGYDTTKSNQNLLKLREIKLLFFKYSTAGGVPGNCIYGNINGSNCEMRNYMENPSTFSFNPLVDILKLSFQDLGNKLLNFISVSSPDNPITFVFQNSAFKAAAINPNISLKAGLQDESTYRMKFVATFPEADEDNASATRAFTSPTNQPLPAQLFSDSPGETFSSEAGPFVYSTVNYTVGGNNVKYYGPKLPRIKAGLLLNPVAKVEGNVYVTDFAKKASDVTLHSLGNISSNLRREAVVRNVAKYLNGFTGTPVSGNQTVAIGTTDSINNLTKLVDEPNRKVFYLKDGDLTLGCSGGCAFDANTTFIVENGNIFVNSNIVPTGNNQVGLIALRDLETNAQNQGLLYIDKDVNWLSGVQIYLDRVVQSYDKTVVSLDANGFAQYADDDYARQGRFKNQLVIEGTISSMNGIGNASRSPATDENGSPLAAGTYCSNYNVLSGICRARVVDLNYLRYYGPGLEICTGSEGVGAIAGVPRDQALKAGGNGCDPTDPAYDIDASDLYTNNGDTDLISGGSGGTRSEYFVSKNLSATIANEFPVNFFYRPIAKGLAGFEVDSSINPLLQN